MGQNEMGGQRKDDNMHVKSLVVVEAAPPFGLHRPMNLSSKIYLMNSSPRNAWFSLRFVTVVKILVTEKHPN